MPESHMVCQLSDLRGGVMLAAQIGQDQVAVALVNGQVQAFNDTCPHAACSLAAGDLEGEVVMCPCHSLQFNLVTGKPVSSPLGPALKKYPVRVEGDGVYIEA